jgi:hypothetical protein
MKIKMIPFLIPFVVLRLARYVHILDADATRNIWRFPMGALYSNRKEGENN